MNVLRNVIDLEKSYKVEVKKPQHCVVNIRETFNRSPS